VPALLAVTQTIAYDQRAEEACLLASSLSIQSFRLKAVNIESNCLYALDTSCKECHPVPIASFVGDLPDEFSTTMTSLGGHKFDVYMDSCPTELSLHERSRSLGRAKVIDDEIGIDFNTHDGYLCGSGIYESLGKAVTTWTLYDVWSSTAGAVYYPVKEAIVGTDKGKKYDDKSSSDNVDDTDGKDNKRKSEKTVK
jgi:hypothetical protein